MNLFPYILLALLVGALMPTQAGINAQLRNWVQSPYTSALISFFIGTLVLFLWCLIIKVPWPGTRVLQSSPWWVWIGGGMGAVIVAGSIILAPRLGATSMLALMVSGMMVASLVLDQFGWIGYPQRDITTLRVVGCFLLVAGVVLVQKF